MALITMVLSAAGLPDLQQKPVKNNGERLNEMYLLLSVMFI